MENSRILNIYELKINNEKPWLTRGIGIWTIGLTSTIILRLFDFISSNELLVSIFVFAFVSFFCLQNFYKQKNNHEMKYFEYLKEQNLDIVKKASNSKEMDHISQSMIVKFLNKNHQGWSFQEN